MFNKIKKTFFNKEEVIQNVLFQSVGLLIVFSGFFFWPKYVMVLTPVILFAFGLDFVLQVMLEDVENKKSSDKN